MAIKMKETRQDKIFSVINRIFLGICILIIVYPLIYIISSSFSDPNAVLAGRVILWPVDFSLAGYKAVFQYNRIWTGYANSIYYAGLGTLINVILTIMAAYPLSRKDFNGRNILMFLFTFTMLFNGGLIPTYLVMQKLNLINTRWAMILPTAIAVWNVIITRTYFQTSIPNELLEASKIDGCNDIKFLLKIVIPLSGPIIAVITLFYAVYHWNSFFSALMYLRDYKLYPLQMVLRDILIQNEVDTLAGAVGSIDMEQQAKLEGISELLKYSLIIVASLPLLIAYPFVQKYFVKGVMIGAIKG
jgi:multiple sugar transport system permease protein/putative aldouronate transport system permease protein